MTKANDPKPPRPKRAGPATPANATTGSFQVSDELWEVLASPDPQTCEHPSFRWRPAQSSGPDLCQRHLLRAAHRLPVEGLGRHRHLRFQEWVAAGVFRELWRVGLERYDELQGLDWSWLSMDGAMTKAPLGGGENRPQSHRPR